MHYYDAAYNMKAAPMPTGTIQAKQRKQSSCVFTGQVDVKHNIQDNNNAHVTIHTLQYIEQWHKACSNAQYTK